jgi:hypothetical protein
LFLHGGEKGRGIIGISRGGSGSGAPSLLAREGQFA